MSKEGSRGQVEYGDNRQPAARLAMKKPDHDNRRAASLAQAKEDSWRHPRRMDGLHVTDELQACADPYCRYCKDQDGEVREGFGL